jgi:hypothetical protein
MIFHLAIERYMKRRTGHCGDCYVNYRNVCTDGQSSPSPSCASYPMPFPEPGRPGAGIAC